MKLENKYASRLYQDYTGPQDELKMKSEASLNVYIFVAAHISAICAFPYVTIHPSKCHRNV